MKLQSHNNKLETNSESESQDFSIGDPSVIIDILRNRMYEHKVRSICQELISNARDAMREVGKTNGFEVVVPTRLNPVFKVRDFGPGIAPDRMSNVFIKYGASTKRGTNGQTGGFGIGAKSPFAYTDSFSIVTFIDGIKRAYIAHIGVNNQGRLDLVSTDTTEEENGTEIQVAVKSMDIEEFRTAIFRAVYFWNDKPILKGELHPPTLVKGIQVSDLLEVIHNDMLPEYVRPSYSNEIIGVIDGIPYPINDRLMDKVKHLSELKDICNGRIILHFGNGLVEVAASRESIADSKHTVAALEKMAQKALLEAKTYIADRFGKVKTTQEYIETYVGMSDLFDVDEFAKYGEYEIKNRAITSTLLKKTRMTLIHSYDKRHWNKINKITKDILRESHRDVEIKLFGHLFYSTVTESPMVQNKRIREYLKTNNWIILIEQLNTKIAKLDKNNEVLRNPAGEVILEDASYPNEFKQVIKDLSVRDFTSITYVDPPKVVKAKIKREDTEVCLHYVEGGDKNHIIPSENTQKFVFVKLDGSTWPHKYSRDRMTDLDNYLRKNEDTRVCGVALKAYEVVKNDPNFVTVEDFLATYKPSKDALLYVKNSLGKNRNSFDNLNNLQGVKDKFVLKMVEEYKTIGSGKCRDLPPVLMDKVKEVYRKEVEAFKEADKNFGALMEKQYALVNEVSGWSKHKNELVVYMNLKYNSRKKNV